MTVIPIVIGTLGTDSSENPSANDGEKNLKRTIIIMKNYTHLERITQKENIPTNHDNELINAVEDPN